MKTIEQKVIKFIDRHRLIENGDHVLIGFSGGPDSVFAINFFYKFKKRFGITLAACHINHQLRGKESDKDEEFCRTVSSNYGIKCFVSSIDISSIAKSEKLSIEEAARIKRYEFFEEIAKSQNMSKIITAHNLDDNSETIMLNFFKGTGLAGMSGIPVKRDIIIRPLLCLSKDEVLEYLRINKINFRIDSSNLKNEFQRNFIRNEIIPKIKENINPSLNKALARSSETFGRAQKAIFEVVDELIPTNSSFENNCLEISLELFSEKKEFLFFEIIRSLLKKYYGIESNFDDFMKLSELLGNQTGRKIFISDSIVAIKERKSIIFIEQNENPDAITEIRIGETKRAGSCKISIKSKSKIDILKSQNPNIEIISGDYIDDIFILRRWKNGDKFIPLGMKGFKNVSDFLNEQKVPAHKKREQLVLTNGNSIVWVVGFRIDDRFKIKKETIKVCELWVN